MTFKQEAHKRFFILDKVVKTFTNINVDTTYKKIEEFEDKTKWLFNEKNIDVIVKRINEYSPQLKEYAVKRVFSINMSEMLEYIFAYTLNCEKCNKYDKKGDIKVNDIKYDVKCVSVNWSGKLYRNHNSKYIYIKYFSKLDFIDISKIKKLIELIEVQNYNSDNIYLTI